MSVGHKTLFSWLASVCVCATVVTLPVSAAVFQVTGTDDAVDVVPGDGVCLTAGGSCSVRAAIMEANADSGFDSVVVPAGIYVLTLPGRGEDASATGDLDIRSNLALAGAGADVVSIDANGIDRVLDVGAGVTATVGALTLTGGAGVDSGGGVLNAGILAIEACRIELNGDASQPVRLGAGINNTGALVLTLSQVSGNLAGNSSMVGATGGGIYSLTPLTINASRIVANESRGTQALAGGVFTSVLLQMSTSEIADNLATSGAGVLQLSGDSFINSSTIRGNQSSGQGAGIRVLGGRGEWVNSTWHDNRANGNGGGIQLISGDLVLRNATIAGNRADADNNGTGSGAGLSLAGGTSIVMNTVMADNLRGSTPEDCSGTLTTSTYNVVEFNAGCALGSTDLVVDPMLAAPDLSGATTVLPLTMGSQAIDAGDPTGCLGTQNTVLQIDQRGTRRPQDGDADGIERCDTGAVEWVLDALFSDGFE